MDAATGWCEGCLRTIDEIAAWGRLDDAGRRAMLQQLRPRRMAWRAMQAEGRVPPVTTPGETP
jgi:predicted Fe-S protein YdhL (DUF1289 family)